MNELIKKDDGAIINTLLQKFTHLVDDLDEKMGAFINLDPDGKGFLDRDGTAFTKILSSKSMRSTAIFVSLLAIDMFELIKILIASKKHTKMVLHWALTSLLRFLNRTGFPARCFDLECQK